MNSPDLSQKTISLIGFSLGARVIFSCLKELVSKNFTVHDVFLLGGAAPKTPKK